MAVAAGRPIDPAAPTPAAWREFVRGRTGRTAPEIMTDGEAAEFYEFDSESTDRVDASIKATRDAVFPAHGLIP